jgi:D-3-phosphoglycerate dehydrogenase
MKIIIPEDYQDAVGKLDCFKLLSGHEVIVYNDSLATLDQSIDRLKDADALVLIRERTAITEGLLAGLPNLKLISQTGKISSHLDLAACTRYGVAVTEGVGSPIAPAELTWALIMNAARKIPQAIDDMKRGLWQTNIGSSLHGQTIGIWGYGKIGKMIAGYAKAFGMKIMVWGSESSRKTATGEGLLAAGSKQQFFGSADIITLHLRLVDQTKGIVTAEDLSLMKPTSILVNTSRAELIEEGALLNALHAGRPGFAALDVYEQEPISDKDHPLLNMKNVICTPHLGYVEQKGYELYFSKAFENLIAFANGAPVNLANPEVLQR